MYLVQLLLYLFIFFLQLPVPKLTELVKKKKKKKEEETQQPERRKETKKKEEEEEEGRIED